MTFPSGYVDNEGAAYTFKMCSDPEGLFCNFQQDLDYKRELCNGVFEQ
jgi:hypothetical protein